MSLLRHAGTPSRKNRCSAVARIGTSALQSSWHSQEMIEAYTKQHKTKEAIFHGELACKYGPKYANLNNLGYLFMVSDNLEKAKEFLEESIKKSKEPIEEALRLYNLGIVEAKGNKPQNVLDRFNITIDKAQGAQKRERMCSCLILPKIVNRKLEFEEVVDPDLLETAQAAASTMGEFLNIQQGSS